MTEREESMERGPGSRVLPLRQKVAGAAAGRSGFRVAAYIRYLEEMGKISDRKAAKNHAPAPCA